MATKFFVVALTFVIPLQTIFAFVHVNPEDYPGVKGRTSASGTTLSFGGKVLSDKISGVECNKEGTLVILSSNASGAVGIVQSQQSNNKTEKVVGTSTSIYKLIPFFATNTNKVPRKGGFILGKADVVPDFSICHTTGTLKLPIPVRKTDDYGVSQSNNPF